MKILLTLLSAALLVLSFPSPGCFPLAWVALVPLLYALRGAGALRAVGYSFLFGFVFAQGAFSWFHDFKGTRVADILFLSSYLPLYPALFGLGFHLLTRHGGIPAALAVPLAWVSSELLRSRSGFLSLPLNLLGHSQHSFLDVIQIADVTGAYGVSFLVAFVNGALYDTLRRTAFRGAEEEEGIPLARGFAPLAAALALVMATLLYGRFAFDPSATVGKMEVTVVQGNIPHDMKWKPENREMILRKHMDLTVSAAQGRKGLVIWPETAVPGYLAEISPVSREVSDLARRIGAPLLVGGAGRPKVPYRQIDRQIAQPAGMYNSAFLISPEGMIAGRYDKIHLVPFYEYLPLKGLFDWTERIRSAGGGDYLPGKAATVLSIGGRRFGVAICWESFFPEVFRLFVKNGAEFMVNISNEAMFERAAARYQFLGAVVFRAVENRVTIARSVNTGVSCIIDPRGEVLDRVRRDGKDVFVEGTLTREVGLHRERTFYTLHGDVFAAGCVVATTGLLIFLPLQSVWRRDPDPAGTAQPCKAPMAQAPTGRGGVPCEG